MTPPASTRALGLGLLMAGSAVDSTSGVLTRLTASDGFTTAAARGLFAFAFLFAVLCWRSRGGALAAIVSLGWIGAAFVGINASGMVLNILSLKLTSVANFFMIFATAPFVAAILGRIVLGERLDRPTLLAALAGFGGIAVMMAGQSTGINLGDALAGVVVVIYALNVLIVRRSPALDILPLITMTVLASGVFALPFASFGGLGAQDWLVLGALGFFQLGTGNLLIFAAVRRISAAEAGLLGIMGAVFAPTWAFLALHEVPGPLTLIGGSVILTAAALHLAWSIARPGAASAPRP